VARQANGSWPPYQRTTQPPLWGHGASPNSIPSDRALFGQEALITVHLAVCRQQPPVPLPAGWADQHVQHYTFERVPMECSQDGIISIPVLTLSNSYSTCGVLFSAVALLHPPGLRLQTMRMAYQPGEPVESPITVEAARLWQWVQENRGKPGVNADQLPSSYADVLRAVQEFAVGEPYVPSAQSWRAAIERQTAAEATPLMADDSSTSSMDAADSPQLFSTDSPPPAAQCNRSVGIVSEVWLVTAPEDALPASPSVRDACSSNLGKIPTWSFGEGQDGVRINYPRIATELLSMRTIHHSATAPPAFTQQQQQAYTNHLDLLEQIWGPNAE